MNATRTTLALIAAGALLIAALLCFSPMARADEPDVGSLICGLLALGDSPAQIAAAARNGDPAISEYNVTQVVWAIARQCGGPTVRL
jgi:hypothetical protein